MQLNEIGQRVGKSRTLYPVVLPVVTERIFNFDLLKVNIRFIFGQNREGFTYGIIHDCLSHGIDADYSIYQNLSPILFEENDVVITNKVSHEYFYIHKDNADENKSVIDVIFYIKNDPSIINAFKSVAMDFPMLLEKARASHKLAKVQGTKYGEEALANLGESVVFQLNAVVTNDELDQSKVEENRHLIEYMSNSKDIDFANKLSKANALCVFNKRYGNTLSTENALAVILQKEDATFVTSEQVWRDHYGRKVVPNAQPIIIYRSLNTLSNSQSLDTAAQQSGYEHAKVEDIANSSVQRFMIDAVANQSKGGNRFFYTKVYDISDTFVVDPSKDCFGSELGVSNNLNGQINNTTHDETGLNYSHYTPDLKAYQSMFKNIEALAQNVGCPSMMTPRKLSLSYLQSAIPDYLKNIAKKMLEQQGFTNNIDNGALAISNIICFLCHLTKQKPNRSLRKYRKQEKVILNNVFNEIFKAVNIRNNVDTSIDPFVELTDTATPQGNMIAESTYRSIRSMFNRLDLIK